MSIFGGVGVQPTARGQASNAFALNGGQTRIIPGGSWMVKPGPYSTVQEFDTVTNIWRGIGAGVEGGNSLFVRSDGVNMRVANQSGCVVGALLTAAGSGYSQVNPPTVTVSGASAATVQVIMGSVVSTTVSVTNGGANYVYPPLVFFDFPPSPGIQATGTATLTNGAVSSITVVDQGAGYSNVPVIYLINDPRDTTGYGASAVATLTGLGGVTGLLVTDFGNAVTAVPTLTFSSGSATAVAIMNFAVTGYTVTTAGVAYGTTGTVTAVGVPGSGFSGTSPAFTNPTTQSKLVTESPSLVIPTVTAGALATGGVVRFGGSYSGVPTLQILSTTPPTTVGALAATVGAAVDVTTLLPC